MAALTWADAAHLLRCTGFGATGKDVDAVAGQDAGTVIQAIVTVDPTQDPGVVATPSPTLADVPLHDDTASKKEQDKRRNFIQEERRRLIAWWFARMVAAQQPFVERLTFAWHDVWATSMEKVRLPPMMLRQNETLRQNGRGDFRDLATEMLKDAALQFWLDNPANRANNPNENLARESLELFMLGHGDGYTEDDVHNVARALTGWSIDKVKGVALFDQDTFASGDKTILGQTHDFDVDSYVSLVVQRPASAAFVLQRLWSKLISDTPMDDATRTTGLAGYGSSRSVGGGIAALLGSGGFAAARGTRVVSPIEWTIGLGRAVGVDHTDADTLTLLHDTTTALGQEPFYPPSVGGWPSGAAWLSTTAAMTRGENAALIVAKGDVSAVSDAAATDRVDAAAHLLGVAAWSARSRAALAALGGDPATIVAMAANTPEYLTT